MRQAANCSPEREEKVEVEPEELCAKGGVRRWCSSEAGHTAPRLGWRRQHRRNHVQQPKHSQRAMPHLSGVPGEPHLCRSKRSTEKCGEVRRARRHCCAQGGRQGSHRQAAAAAAAAAGMPSSTTAGSHHPVDNWRRSAGRVERGTGEEGGVSDAHDLARSHPGLALHMAASWRYACWRSAAAALHTPAHWRSRPWPAPAARGSPRSAAPAQRAPRQTCPQRARCAARRAAAAAAAPAGQAANWGTRHAPGPRQQGTPDG